MGNITDPEQHQQDAAALRMLAEIVPAYRRHLSHHLRNSLTTLYNSVALAQRDLGAKNYEALLNHFARLEAVCEHIKNDIEEAGL